MTADIMEQFSAIKTWREICCIIPEITKVLKTPLFRGQGNSWENWKLIPSLYRESEYIKSTLKGRHPRFIDWLTGTIFAECGKEIESLIERQVNRNSKKDQNVVMGILQHLRLPTPLLDWTCNPFKAVYFAFEGMCEASKEVAIFLIDNDAWGKCPSRDPRIVWVEEPKSVLPRQRAQECVYIYSHDEEGLEVEISADECGDHQDIFKFNTSKSGGENKEKFIACCHLPVSEREEALKYLKEKEIDKESLYPDKKDLILATLREKIERLYKCLE
ncbi:MAG: FRG domain-containing protein [Candidatus Ratteibacteria bacterium]|nr:FRG domain-containing protein [Candidatus Ratteibacteria bacterium]